MSIEIPLPSLLLWRRPLLFLLRSALLDAGREHSAMLQEDLQDLGGALLHLHEVPGGCSGRLLGGQGLAM